MQLELLNEQGQAAGKVDAADTVFAREYNEALGVKDVTWLAPGGEEMTEEHWHDEHARCLGVLLDGRAQPTGILRSGEDATLLLILYAGLSRWPQRLPGLAALGVVSLFLVAGLAAGTEGFIGPLRRVDLFHALLTPAYPLLAWLLLTLRAPAGEEIPVKTL